MKQMIPKGGSADERAPMDSVHQSEVGIPFQETKDHLRVVTTEGDLSVSVDLQSEPRIELPASTESEPTLRSTVGVGAVRLRFRALGLILAGIDVLCLAGTLVLSQILSLGVDGQIPIPLPAVLGTSALWVVVFHGFGLYSPQHLSAHEVFRRVISASSVGMVLLVIVSLGWHPTLSRQWIALTWFFALLFELSARRVLNWWIYKLTTDGWLAYRTLIIGTNGEASRLNSTFEDASYGFLSIGYVALGAPGQSNGAAPVVGTLDELTSVINRFAVDCVFVASTAVDVDQMAEIHRIVRRTGVELRVSANLPEILSSRLSVKPVGDIMAISLRPVTLTGMQAAVKRTFDIGVSVVGLLMALPLMAAIAALVKLTSPGSIIFKQNRVTAGGRNFSMYKFRTMVNGAEGILDQQDRDRSTAFFKVREDSSITPVGRWLRRFSLDEVPQLWNILKGDMSLVGPRPLPAEQVAANLSLLEPRHEVRAGLTGWWQINGRSDVNPNDSVRMDLFYIENWSLALDLYILLKTAGAVLVRRGAY
jgi:exopolysaccharide biosynthesis polyprenyl glycosylphosphotransferase